MKKTMLVFGLIAGAIISLTMTISMFWYKNNPNNFDKGELIGYLSMLLAFSFIFVAIKSYRDRYNAGIITFKKALWLGLGISVIASIFYVVTWVIIYKNVYPNFLEEYSKHVIAKMQSAGKSAADIEKANKEMKDIAVIYSTWLGLIGITFLEIFPVGLVVSLISAAILKRKTPKLTVAK